MPQNNLKNVSAQGGLIGKSGCPVLLPAAFCAKRQFLAVILISFMLYVIMELTER